VREEVTKGTGGPTKIARKQPHCPVRTQPKCKSCAKGRKKDKDPSKGGETGRTTEDFPLGGGS